MSRMCPVVPFEMPARDRARMARFYERVFGWKTEALGAEMGNVLVTTAESDAKPGTPAGAINGGFFPAKAEWPVQHPSLVIAVQDIRTAMRDVNDAGGEVLGELYEIPAIGLHVYSRDSEGSFNRMLQPERYDQRT